MTTAHPLILTRSKSYCVQLVRRAVSAAFPRYARKGFEIDDVPIHAGELMLLDIKAANNDPTVFRDSSCLEPTVVWRGISPYMHSADAARIASFWQITLCTHAWSFGLPAGRCSHTPGPLNMELLLRENQADYWRVQRQSGFHVNPASALAVGAER